MDYKRNNAKANRKRVAKLRKEDQDKKDRSSGKTVVR